MNSHQGQELSHPKRRRRQVGSERRLDPMSIVHPIPKARSIIFGRIAILVTVLAWLLYILNTVVRMFLDNQRLGSILIFQSLGYVTVISLLTFSALMYLLARQGALYRFQQHRRVARGDLDRHFANYDREITVLVPSYQEEPQVVRMTLWSAALQEFPAKRVVLLIDDPPDPKDSTAQEMLESARRAPQEIQTALSEPSRRFQAAYNSFQQRPPRTHTEKLAVLDHLITQYEAAAQWLEQQARAESTLDHMAKFYVEYVLIGLASELRLVLIALNGARAQRKSPDLQTLRAQYVRLVRTFTVTMDSFERKQYISLSHEPNKAMNLNSYLGLMGHRWYREQTVDGIRLRSADHVLPDTPPPTPANTSNFTAVSAMTKGVHYLEVPDTYYVLTLDADSQLLRDYCLRLVYLMEESGSERVAVCQTPYSSFRGAPTRIERIAGATTDLQHILHQGMTYYNATFWVGANAVIRKKALEDIAVREHVDGSEIVTYIQDRTVIEDTESTIDLGTHNWELVNYPERLSYSATPPDFGSLIVQRRRWANGGLLILPNLGRQLRERRYHRRRILLREILLRFNYMASLSWASLGLLFILAFPYDSRLLSPFVFLAAVPYFAVMGADLRRCGHRFMDIFRIYGFNLILLPVNLAGVLKSLQQGVTGEKIPFARTPKIDNRTPAAAIYILVPYAIVYFSLFVLWREYLDQNWGAAIFAGFNALMAAYAIKSYIGIWYSFADTWLSYLNWLYVPKRKPQAESQTFASPVTTSGAPSPVNWESILYHGDRRLARDQRGAADRRRRVTQ